MLRALIVSLIFALPLHAETIRSITNPDSCGKPQELGSASDG